MHLKIPERKIYLSCSHPSTPVRVTALPDDFIPQTFQLSSAVAAQKFNYCAAFPHSPENGNSVSVPPVNLGHNPKPTESIKELLLAPAGWNVAQGPLPSTGSTPVCLSQPSDDYPACISSQMQMLKCQAFIHQHVSS